MHDYKIQFNSIVKWLNGKNTIKGKGRGSLLSVILVFTGYYEDIATANIKENMYYYVLGIFSFVLTLLIQGHACY